MLSWSLAVVAILSGLGPSEGQQNQKDICNFDPDVIFFDNEDLEKLRKSYTFGGECSPVVLKAELGDLVESYNNRFGRDIDELSVQDRRRLRELSEHRPPVSRSNRHFEVKPSLKNSELYRRIVKPGYRVNDQDIFEHDNKNVAGISPPDYYRPFGNPLLTEDFFGRHHNQDGFLPMEERKRRQGQERRRPLFDPDPNMFQPGEDNFGNGVRLSRPDPRRRPTTSRPASSGLRPSLAGLSADQLSSPMSGSIRPMSGSIRPMSGSIRPMSGSIRPGSQRKPSTPQTTTPRPAGEATTLPGPPSWATPPSACVQRCPITPEYNPICGSDRVTYNNPGRLRCEQQCGKNNVELRFFGVCTETVVDTGLLNRVQDNAQ